MKVLETRMRPDGIKARRYQLEDGRRITTFELPATVIKGVGLKRVQEFMEIWQRGEKARAETKTRRQRIEELLAQNIKPTAIAFEIGVTEARVRQIRKEMEDGRKRKRATPIQREPKRVLPEVGGNFRTQWVGGRSPFAR